MSNQYILTEAPVMDVPKAVKKLGDKIRFEACIQTANDVNRNKRLYEKATLMESVNKIMPDVRASQFLGELDHPTDSNINRQLVVLYKEVSHKFIDLSWDGNKLNAIIETLVTPNGMILRNLIAENGLNPGFSMRGMGDIVQMEGIMKVCGDLKIICWDSVSSPSHVMARMSRITENSYKHILESYNQSCSCLTESNFVEHNGMICTEDGRCYLPNAFDMLVENRKKELRNKFSI